MKNLLIGLIFVGLLSSGFYSADAAQYCQQDNNCSACETDDQFCSSVNGKRIDSGGSLGTIHNPPANSERQLQKNTWELVPYKKTLVKQVEVVPTHVNRTELKQVIDSSVAPKFGYGKSVLTPSLQADLAQLATQLLDKQNLQKIDLRPDDLGSPLSWKTVELSDVINGIGTRQQRPSFAALLTLVTSLPRPYGDVFDPAGFV